MARKRAIPFGYKMESGDIVPHPEETEAVVFIYDSYHRGESYLTIANAMCGLGVRYHEASAEWNKHMVKRILENPKYIGQNEYPAILPADIWNGAQTIRDRKTAGYNNQSLCVETVKRSFFCGECGAAISKDASIKDGIRHWHCSNTECGVAVTMRDSALEKAIITLLNRLISAPELFDVPESAKRAASLEAARIQNKINHELNKADIDEEYLTSLILSCAAEKYAVLDDVTDQRKITRLKVDLQEQALLTAFDSVLYHDAVEAVLVMADKTIALRIAGGNIIS